MGNGHRAGENERKGVVIQVKARKRTVLIWLNGKAVLGSDDRGGVLLVLSIERTLLAVRFNSLV